MLRAGFCCLVLFAAACLPRVAKQRLENTTPIAVGYIVDPTYSGAPTTAPDKLKEALTKVLEERNLSVVEVPFERFGDERITDTRKAALKAAAPDAAYHLLVELRVHFFSQIDGRYRWEVGTSLSAAKAEGVESKDAFEVPVILVYDHEKQRAAMNAASTDIGTHLSTLIDGLLVNRKKATSTETPPSFQQPLAPGQLVPPKKKPADETQPEPAPKSSRTPRNIYFAMVDRFANGDRSNDGDANPNDPQAFHGGDLLGLRNRLDWLQGLGVDTVWLSPVFSMRTSPWHGYGAFHGYWTYDWNNIEPRLGTEAQLVELADELHRRGMQLMVDVVLNHVGPEAPLVLEKPEWFHQKGGITDWNDPVQLTTFDVHGLPDLATEREEVVAYLTQAGRRWL
jgi:hypothetical protein